MIASVKGLGFGVHWLGAGIGFSGCPQTENIPQSGNGFAGQSGVQVSGQSGAISESIRPFGVLVPGAMG